jgi:putative transposase
LDIGHRRVGRLMRQNDISVVRMRKHKLTTDSDHKFNIAPNLLDRNFTADGPNLKWAGDISYVWTREGWLYLAVILDLHSRRVIGWAVSNRMKRDLAIRALTMAITFRQPPKGSIHHTDRGSQYCSHDYQKLLRQHGFKRRRRSGGFKIVKYKHGLSFPEGHEKTTTLNLSQATMARQ